MWWYYDYLQGHDTTGHVLVINDELFIMRINSKISLSCSCQVLTIDGTICHKWYKKVHYHWLCVSTNETIFIEAYQLVYVWKMKNS